MSRGVIVGMDLMNTMSGTNNKAIILDMQGVHDNSRMQTGPDILYGAYDRASGKFFVAIDSSPGRKNTMIMIIMLLCDDTLVHTGRRRVQQVGTKTKLMGP